MKVYLIMYGLEGELNETVLKVFRTKDKADAFVAKYILSFGEYLRIEEVEVE